jgi:hypothetical protein
MAVRQGQSFRGHSANFATANGGLLPAFAGVIRLTLASNPAHPSAA